MSAPPKARRHRAAKFRAIGMASDLPPAYSSAGSEDGRIWAMMAYLGVMFLAFLLPVVLYLVGRRRSPFVRYHAAQALNLWITVFLYSVSFLIIGGVLALDSVAAALALAGPLIAASAAAMLGYAVLAALSARRGETCRLPAWVCAPLVK